jgi:hypothetical protein
MSAKCGPDQRQIGKGESKIDRAIILSAADQPMVGPRGLFDQSSSRACERTSPGPAKSLAASASAICLEFKVFPLPKDTDLVAKMLSIHPANNNERRNDRSDGRPTGPKLPIRTLGRLGVGALSCLQQIANRRNNRIGQIGLRYEAHRACR